MEHTITVGDLARLAGITVRTLHHYDDIALLVPSGRRPNGYRAYADEDIARLQQILTYRELGLGLDEISRILAEPSGRAETLMAARDRIEQRINKLRYIANGLDTAIRAERGETDMTSQERLEAFGTFEPDEFAAESSERWGSTDAYAESARRTGAYTTQDWTRQRIESDELDQRFLGLADAGIAAHSKDAAALVDDHRAHITKWFYPCTPEIHAGLGTMYVSDDRFMSRIDEAGEGLAEYLSAAIEARYEA